MVSRNGKLILAAALSSLVLAACSNDKNSRHGGAGASGDASPFVGVWAPADTHELYGLYVQAKRARNQQEMFEFCRAYARKNYREFRRSGFGVIHKGLLIQTNGKIYNYRGVDERLNSASFQRQNYLGAVDYAGYVKVNQNRWSAGAGEEFGYPPGAMGWDRNNRNQRNQPHMRPFAHVNERIVMMSRMDRELVVEFQRDEYGQRRSYQRAYVEVSFSKELRHYPKMMTECRRLEGRPIQPPMYMQGGPEVYGQEPMFEDYYNNGRGQQQFDPGFQGMPPQGMDPGMDPGMNPEFDPRMQQGMPQQMPPGMQPRRQPRRSGVPDDGMMQKPGPRQVPQQQMDGEEPYMPEEGMEQEQGPN